MTRRHLLILGGTGEAAALARAALARFGETAVVSTALPAGTRRPGPIPGRVRIGGFADAAALATYLAAERVDCLIDATHPFSAAISAAARLACDRIGLPRLMLLRPPLRRHPLDRWIEVDSIEAAAAIVDRVGRRAWLAVGAGSIPPFARAEGVRFLVRLDEPPPQRLPLRFHQVEIGCGPFTLAEERHLLQRHAIDVLVCRAGGGAAGEAKLIAARELSLPVVMVRRPPPEPGRSVDTIDAALDWLGGDERRSAAWGRS